MTIELDGNLYQIVEFQHIKLGRGSAQMRMKLRNVRKGDLIEKTFQAGDRFQRARLDHRNVQFMYRRHALPLHGHDDLRPARTRRRDAR